MDKETRQKIAELSREIDGLNTTLELVKTSNVLCFTTMDRSVEDTVTLEFKAFDGENVKNRIFAEAQGSTIKYLELKIEEKEKMIDSLIEKK